MRKRRRANLHQTRLAAAALPDSRGMLEEGREEKSREKEVSLYFCSPLLSFHVGGIRPKLYYMTLINVSVPVIRLPLFSQEAAAEVAGRLRHRRPPS